MESHSLVPRLSHFSSLVVAVREERREPKLEVVSRTVRIKRYFLQLFVHKSCELSFRRLAAYFARGDPSDWRFSPAGLISHETLHLLASRNETRAAKHYWETFIAILRFLSSVKLNFAERTQNQPIKMVSVKCSAHVVI